MTSKIFNSVATTVIGDGTVKALVDWLENYVKILFPENGIEYWSNNRYADSSGLKPTDPLPTTIGHVACYVHTGHSEGRILEVGLDLKDFGFRWLTWAKTFGSEAECWEIARAVSLAMECIFIWNEVPDITEIGMKLPRERSFSTKTSCQSLVTVLIEGTAITVSAASGEVFDHKSFDGLGANHALEAYQKDWIKVLELWGAVFEQKHSTQQDPMAVTRA